MLVERFHCERDSKELKCGAVKKKVIQNSTQKLCKLYIEASGSEGNKTPVTFHFKQIGTCIRAWYVQKVYISIAIIFGVLNRIVIKFPCDQTNSKTVRVWVCVCVGGRGGRVVYAYKYLCTLINAQYESYQFTLIITYNFPCPRLIFNLHFGLSSSPRYGSLSRFPHFLVSEEFPFIICQMSGMYMAYTQTSKYGTHNHHHHYYQQFTNSTKVTTFCV